MKESAKSQIRGGSNRQVYIFIYFLRSFTKRVSDNFSSKSYFSSPKMKLFSIIQRKKSLTNLELIVVFSRKYTPLSLRSLLNNAYKHILKLVYCREDVGEAPGKDCEVKTQGGEVNFIFNMAEQSSRQGNQNIF